MYGWEDRKEESLGSEETPGIEKGRDLLKPQENQATGAYISGWYNTE